MWVGASADASFTRTAVSSNALTGAGSGGGLYVSSYADARLVDCQVSSNRVAAGVAYGGGVYVGTYAALTVNGTLVQHNRLQSTGHGAGVYLASYSTLRLQFSDVCSNAIASSGNGGAVGTAVLIRETDLRSFEDGVVVLMRLGPGSCGGGSWPLSWATCW